MILGPFSFLSGDLAPTFELPAADGQANFAPGKPTAFAACPSASWGRPTHEHLRYDAAGHCGGLTAAVVAHAYSSAAVAATRHRARSAEQ